MAFKVQWKFKCKVWMTPAALWRSFSGSSFSIWPKTSQRRQIATPPRIQNVDHKSTSHMREWSNTTEDKMVFLAMIVIMEILPKPYLQLYWTRDSILESLFFPRTTCTPWFIDLLFSLHLLSVTDNNQGDASNWLCKIYPVILTT